MHKLMNSKACVSLVSSLLLLGAIGCGDGTGLATRYPVKGTVTYNGKPVEKGSIEFVPENNAAGQAATGEIKDGSYYLTTAIDGDGALPGKYKVQISSKEVDLSKAEANIKDKGGSLHQEDVAAANRNAKNLIPSKYSLAETSGLSFEVKEQSNTADFDLKD